MFIKGQKEIIRKLIQFYPNNYAWSKLGGECAVQMYKNSLIRDFVLPKNHLYINLLLKMQFQVSYLWMT